MKAMILAAGYGTRLKPLTEKIPKALVKVSGVALLEIAIKKLISAGVSDIVVNTHHYAKQVESFINEKQQFGIKIVTSFEPEILGTGGGLKKAANFFNDNQPFLVHNVDIFSTIDLKKLIEFHKHKEALVTLAVKNRQVNRSFLIDEKNIICGHEDKIKKLRRIKRQPCGELRSVGFSGIHVISPEIFEHIDKDGYFSIIDVYLNQIEKDFMIFGYPTDEYYWKDIGKLNAIAEFEDDVKIGKIKKQDLMK